MQRYSGGRGQQVNGEECRCSGTQVGRVSNQVNGEDCRCNSTQVGGVSNQVNGDRRLGQYRLETALADTLRPSGNGKVAGLTLEAPGQMHVQMSVSSGISCTLAQILVGGT